MKKPKIIPAVLIPADNKPGEAAVSDLQAPIADGTNVSIPPGFDGTGAGISHVGSKGPKLGIGAAEPAFHGGG